MNARLEAAARALHESEWSDPWDGAGEEWQTVTRRRAAKVLAAVDALDTTEWAVRDKRDNVCGMGAQDAWESFSEADSVRGTCEGLFPSLGPHYLVKRRAAGPWLPVTEGNDQ